MTDENKTTYSVRTRFAPSPTGYLHVGGIRTALFAWLLARQNKGAFILRLEDTDQKREVAGSAEHLIKSLKALGLFYDEGPDAPGKYGPYRQSERLSVYRKWAQKLIDEGRAYADPYSKDEIDSFRQQAIRSKKAFLYRHHRPENPPQWDGLKPLRFKSDPKSYTWHDEVMGELTTGPDVIDDFIIMKSDGFPTYNFSHIIDDFEMQITHIIRGQEFISSQSNYLNLYEALGFTPPKFATVPHILAPTGGKKLSKRDGAKDVLDYLNDGFLSEALVNFIASMGWNDGSEQEIFSRNELIAAFRLDHVQKSGARFDEKRLEWMNGQWIRRLHLDELYTRVEEYWPTSAASASTERKKKILQLVQDRLKKLSDLTTATEYFFAKPTIDWTIISDNKQLKKLPHSELIDLITASEHVLENTSFTAQNIQTSLNVLLETTGQKPGVLFSLIRSIVSWAPFSPGLPETLEALGKETTLTRLKKARDYIASIT